MRQMVERMLGKAGLIQSPELREAISRSSEVNEKSNRRIDLAEAIKQEARDNERRVRGRL